MEARLPESGVLAPAQAGGPGATAMAAGTAATAAPRMPEDGAPQAVTPVTRVRQQFPEAWIWTESMIGYMH